MIFGRPRGQVVIVVVVAAAIGVGVWWFAVRSSGSPPNAQASSSSTDVSARSLQALVAALGRPVFWAGPKHGVTYEFTETSDKRVYVRYLPTGVAAGSAKPFLTVASYPVANAFAVTSSAAGQPDAVKLGAGTGVAFYNKARPTNVYMAFPGTNVQLEVYDPSAQSLRKLIAAGSIRRIAATVGGHVVTTHAAITSKAALAKLSKQLGRPVYWLGSIAGTKLELTKTPDGRVYVRYIPAGVPAGATSPYLTVATYPVANGLAATGAEAGRADAVKISLPNGAIAFFSKARPTNVYIAYPGAAEQIEVYDPSAARVHALVASGKITPAS